MKKLVVRHPDACTHCHICEDTCSKAYYKQIDREFSCIHIPDEGPALVCTQCGRCAEVCPTEAISKNKLGVYVIDKNACVGCLACFDICPEQAIVKSPDRTIVSKCVACGLCAKACPADVLEIERD